MTALSLPDLRISPNILLVITDRKFLIYLPSIVSNRNGFISTIKPDIPKKPEVKIEYNDRTYQSYIDAGFGDLVSPGSSTKWPTR